MVLPLIGLGLVGLYGVGKAIIAADESSTADSINNDAERTVRKIQEKLEENRLKANNTLADLGEKKFSAVTKNLNDFVEVFGQLKHTELLSNQDLGNLTLSDFDDKAINTIRSDVSMLTSSAAGLGAGALAGGMTAFGAYSGTAMLASASTGTAISTLSGAAATNATLAWLGGGSLAAGGGGIAMGTMVLGGLVAGPALAIFGSIVGAKAEKKLNDAKANRAQAEEFESETEVAITKLNGIFDLTTLMIETLSKLRTRSRRHVTALKAIINEAGTDYRQFTEEQKKHVAKTATCAKLLKAIVDTPILDENGNLMGDSETNVKRLVIDMDHVGS
jgi:hypothetical protein